MIQKLFAIMSKMTKRELRAYYGHGFGPLYKPTRVMIYKDWVFDLDRSESIIRVYPAAEILREVKKGFDTFTPEQWIKKGNELYRGQPFQTAADNAIEYFSQCEA